MEFGLRIAEKEIDPNSKFQILKSKFTSGASTMANILVIDDDKKICEALTEFITHMGHSTNYALTLKEGLEELKTKPFDLVFLDVRLPDGNGLAALPTIRKTASSPEIIIITGEGDPDGAELAIKNGCWDYIEKPLSMVTVTLPLTRVIQYRKEKTSKKQPVVIRREGIIGDSSEIRHCLDHVAMAAETDTNVLINGETGTGKELFAHAIHENSHRSSNPFVVVDCAALPETLVESILFGHKKGAFTGADRNRSGLIKQADKGTLFLDEIGELPINVQGSFLRVLQEGSFRHVGDDNETTSDFRLIAATNRNLDQMVDKGRFRKDLLFRIKTTMIDLPPLRERIKDIREIAFYYMAKFCDGSGTGTKGFSPEFLEALTRYHWPGNIRELVNAIEGAASVARHEGTLFPIHLPDNIRTWLARDAIVPKTDEKPSFEESSQTLESLPILKELIETTEKEYFKNLVSKTEGNIQDICRISGISRAIVYARLKKYNLSRHSS